MNKYRKVFNYKNFILFFFDILIVNLSYFLALFLRFDLEFSQIPSIYLNGFRNYALINTGITLAVYSYFRMYKMILEYASYNELINITQGVIL